MQSTTEKVTRYRLLFERDYESCPLITHLLYPNSPNDLEKLQFYLLNFEQVAADPNVKNALIEYNDELFHFIADNENDPEQDPEQAKAIAIAKLLLFLMQEHKLLPAISSNEIKKEISVMFALMEKNNEYEAIESVSKMLKFSFTHFNQETKQRITNAEKNILIDYYNELLYFISNNKNNYKQKNAVVIAELLLLLMQEHNLFLKTLNKEDQIRSDILDEKKRQAMYPKILNIIISEVFKISIPDNSKKNLSQALLDYIEFKRIMRNYKPNSTDASINKFKSALENLLIDSNLDTISSIIIDSCQSYFQQAENDLINSTDITDNDACFQKQRLLQELIIIAQGAKIRFDPKQPENTRKQNFALYCRSQSSFSNQFFSPLWQRLIVFFKNILKRRNHAVDRTCKKGMEAELSSTIIHPDGTQTLPQIR